MKKIKDEPRYDSEMDTHYRHRKWHDDNTNTDITINQDADGKYHAKIENESGSDSIINQDRGGLLNFFLKRKRRK